MSEEVESTAQEAVQPPKLEVVENDVRAAYDRLPQIQKSRKLLFWLKLALPIGVFAIVLLGFYVIFSTARHNVVDRKDELWSEFQIRAKNVVPRVQRQLDASAEKVLPELRQKLGEAQRKAGLNLPDALARHTKGLGTRLETTMGKEMDVALGKANLQQRSKLKAAYPLLLECQPTDTPKQCKEKEADLDRLMQEIQRAYRDWAMMEMRTTFDGHLRAMDDIRGTMANFAASGPGAAKGVADAPGDMLMLWLELVAESMGAGNELFEKEGVTDTPAPTKGGGAP